MGDKVYNIDSFSRAEGGRRSPVQSDGVVGGVSRIEQLNVKAVSGKLWPRAIKAVSLDKCRTTSDNSYYAKFILDRIGEVYKQYSQLVNILGYCIQNILCVIIAGNKRG